MSYTQDQARASWTGFSPWVSDWLSADAWAEVGLMATLVDIHTSDWHGSAWANSVLHPWSEIEESGFELCFSIFCWVGWFHILCFFFFFLDPMAGLLFVSGITTYLPSMLMLSNVAKSGQPRSRTQ